MKNRQQKCNEYLVASFMANIWYKRAIVASGTTLLLVLLTLLSQASLFPIWVQTALTTLMLIGLVSSFYITYRYGKWGNRCKQLLENDDDETNGRQSE